jgi:hypothetical protein
MFGQAVDGSPHLGECIVEVGCAGLLNAGVQSREVLLECKNPVSVGGDRVMSGA